MQAMGQARDAGTGKPKRVRLPGDHAPGAALTMRYDCPLCEKSLEGKFIRWSKIQRKDNKRSCPHCGGEIEHLMHPEEVVTRALAIVVAVGAFYAIAQGGSVARSLLAALGVLAAAYAVARYRLRDAPRYRKGRN
jgi:DNA-directed RNA polymerase subunit RPC12/RpoP